MKTKQKKIKQEKQFYYSQCIYAIHKYVIYVVYVVRYIRFERQKQKIVLKPTFGNSFGKHHIRFD